MIERSIPARIFRFVEQNTNFWLRNPCAPPLRAFSSRYYNLFSPGQLFGCRAPLGTNAPLPRPELVAPMIRITSILNRRLRKSFDPNWWRIKTDEIRVLTMRATSGSKATLASHSRNKENLTVFFWNFANVNLKILTTVRSWTLHNRVWFWGVWSFT